MPATARGLTPPAWHLFAVFVAAIASVLAGAFPLLTSTMLAVATVVLTGTISPAKAFGGFANASVLLVVIAFLVQAPHQSQIGIRDRLGLPASFICSRPWEAASGCSQRSTRF